MKEKPVATVRDFRYREYHCASMMDLTVILKKETELSKSNHAENKIFVVTLGADCTARDKKWYTTFGYLQNTLLIVIYEKRQFYSRLTGRLVYTDLY